MVQKYVDKLKHTTQWCAQIERQEEFEIAV